MIAEPFEYEVALSFADEDRHIVDEVAKCLRSQDISVFYDDFEKVKTWGKNLHDYFQEIYSTKAKYCVMFISKYYAEKLWTNLERQTAQARALKEKQEYILPIRFDDTEIPGILTTIQHYDAKKKSSKDICEMIISKIRNTPLFENQDLPDEIHIPKIKRTISDLEKSKFLKDTFETIRNYFQKALKQLEKQNFHCNTNYNNVTSMKFVSEIYVEGELKNSCKIWYGSSSFGSNSINFLSGGKYMDINNDNSLNDSAALEDNGLEMYYRLTMSMFSRDTGIDTTKASPEDVAKYLWHKFIEHLH